MKKRLAILFSLSLFGTLSCGGKKEGNANLSIDTSFNDARVLNADFISCKSVVSGFLDADVEGPALQVPPITITWNGLKGPESTAETGPLRIFQIELILTGQNLSTPKVSFSITSADLAATFFGATDMNNKVINKGDPEQSVCNNSGPFYVGTVPIKDKEQSARGTLLIAVDGLVTNSSGRDEVVSSTRSISWEYNPTR